MNDSNQVWLKIVAEVVPFLGALLAWPLTPRRRGVPGRGLWPETLLPRRFPRVLLALLDASMLAWSRCLRQVGVSSRA